MNFADHMIQHADDAHEAIRAINHLSGPPVPAATAYRVIGNLYCAAFSLDQVLRDLGDNLRRSLDTYEVYEDNGSDPHDSIITARLALHEAGDHATRIGQLLQAAQNAIAGQGHHGPKAAQ